MSCCNNPSVQYRSPEDKRILAVYCPIAEKANTNMFYNWRSCTPLNQEIKEGFCSSCAGIMDYTRSGYGNLSSAYSTNNFPCPTGGKSCIGINQCACQSIM